MKFMFLFSSKAKLFKEQLFVFSFLIFVGIRANAQEQLVLTPAIPSLEFNSSSHLGGMADIGAVASAFYSQAGLYQNPALLSSNKCYAGLNFSHMPIYLYSQNDVRLRAVNAFYSIDSLNVVGYSYSNFSLGAIELIDDNGYGNGYDTPTHTIYPTESFHKFSYARAITRVISLGLAVRIIDSNMGIGKTVKTATVDLGFSYRRHFSLADQLGLHVNCGSSINHFGPKVSYSTDDMKWFMPTNLKLAALVTPKYKPNDKVTFDWDVAVQVEKDLIPSIPMYSADDNELIVKGYDPNVSPFKALVQSFYDSPNGFKGELDELRYRFGTELRANYDQKAYLALRAGSYNLYPAFSDARITTIGIGFGLFGFSFDYKQANQKGESKSNYSLTLGYRMNLKGKAFRF